MIGADCRTSAPLFHFHSRPEPIRRTREFKIISQRYPRPLRPDLFSPHPVRTDEVDGERRVNRTAGGLGYGSRATNLCPMGITAGDPRLAAWVLPPRAPRRFTSHTKYQRRKRLGARPLSRSEIFDSVGEAGGRFRSPCEMLAAPA